MHDMIQNAIVPVDEEIEAPVGTQAIVDEFRAFDRTGEKVRLFAAEYVKDFNASRAARVVGYSEMSASRAGSALLKHKSIQEDIRQLIDQKIEECGIQAADVIRVYSAIAFTDFDQLVGWDPNRNTLTLKSPDELSLVEKRAIKRVNVSADGRLQLEMYDKLDALEKLARYFGLFKDRIQLEGTEDKPLHISCDLGLSGRREGD